MIATNPLSSQSLGIMSELWPVMGVGACTKLVYIFSPMDTSNSTGSSAGFTIVAEKNAQKSLYLRLLMYGWRERIKGDMVVLRNGVSIRSGRSRRMK